MPVRNLTNNRDADDSRHIRGANGDNTSGTFSPSTEELSEHGEDGFEDTRDDAYSALLPPNLTNPFLNSSEESSANSDSNDNVNNINSDNSLLPDEQHEKFGSPYRGYYSKEVPNHSYDSSYTNSNSNNTGNSHTLPNRGKNMSTSKYISNIPLSHSFIKAPKPFDRYPTVSNSIPPSIDAKVGNFNGSLNVDALKESTGVGSGSSSNSNNPLPEYDFSPFGGYPTSAFPLTMAEHEADDYLHNPLLEEEARLDRRRILEDIKHMNKRSFGGIVGIIFLFSAAICVFVVLPALTFTGAVYHEARKPVLNETLIQYLTQYEYPQLSAIRTTLVDPDTPSSAKTRKAMDGSTWPLVFSDEFNAEGRTFLVGDDQFWTAPDIHYDATKDLEWYSPDAVTTKNGTLQLRMDAFKTHGLFYRSGMVQSWNKLCVNEGAIEISINLPNYGHVTGLWPGLWTMGNLARPGYLASTDGVWPYSYNSCDAGITPNQSSPDGISYLPGQRLSACTCDGEDHPNPGIGRGAPEIDILEGEVDTVLGVGLASQSLQVAPFDIWYMPDYNFIEIYNFTTTTMNGYCGGPFQQAVSAVTSLNTSWYQFGPDAGSFQTFGLEYRNDDTDGYLQWSIGNKPTYTIHATTLHPNGNINWRQISKEPMSIVMNLGISNNWAYIDWRSIFFPVTFSIDFIRIYQPTDATSLTCDPPDYPTYDYIQGHLLAYTNPNLTHWDQAGFSTPKNILTGKCKSSNFKGN
ncbi:beta-glucan synthesis-associated protein SKN1 KNAG_0B00690 [Huiozyma naganishii CBS 8797]|uniref:GH16 domain-containing protein n=1 Tax=Huiozyma naganishii (strain ATCC MYA-139 / BCRC 22969 / CBS 8797 / KCTC 17520 / NBRC 10181 / NCYC 3082 / Yp74L-3) TaxID=1071383 RepID=J7RUL5_HUIN7|nr:hypothetical protein KNAG_0B00690 [Kazachstania naganishii CBS 8797]CCK68517.1 hypothetical protein KNAG_0B00690 [Kazachstania naganishii CBS 8797]